MPHNDSLFFSAVFSFCRNSFLAKSCWGCCRSGFCGALLSHSHRVLGKETVGMSQAGTGGNTKALGTGRTCNSFDLSLLSVCLPSSSLLQRPFIDASNHISLLALFSQTLLPLCFFSCLFSCFCNPCLPLQHPSPGRATAVFAATTAHHGQG